MLLKVIAGGMSAILAAMAVRKLAEMQDQARVRVRTREAEAQRVTRLRRDPVTGVYHPED